MAKNQNHVPGKKEGDKLYCCATTAKISAKEGGGSHVFNLIHPSYTLTKTRVDTSLRMSSSRPASIFAWKTFIWKRIRGVDNNNDGSIGYSEFVAMMQDTDFGRRHKV
ncbi:hypothetical protein SLEP1_g49299 [Rubroshorea leprosula]|uniref:EF-hand domain-containing protein n=1 Tax=Rubroshorea leprosula TaxID=152421 RepID=A0AAV5LXB4_9ROSI|nr:hypothetical protein SLEP1_g49299 [Rubroshorea leprosula]